MSAGKIDFLDEIVKDAEFFAKLPNESAQRRAELIAPSVVKAKAAGHTKVEVVNIRRKHPLLQSGRLLRIIEQTAADCSVQLSVQYL